MSDLKKLLRLAKLLGIPVDIGDTGRSSDAGYFVYDGKSSKIVVSNHKNKETLLVRVLHELGHALHWIEQGRPDPVDLPQYFNKKQLNRMDRYHQWMFEREAVSNMRRIHHLLNLKFPNWKLEAEMQFDLWVANEVYRKGRYPTRKARIAKDREIRKREKAKYESKQKNG